MKDIYRLLVTWTITCYSQNSKLTNEQPFREAGVVHIQFQVHIAEPVDGLEHVAVQRRSRFTGLRRYLLKLRRRRRRDGGNALQ